MQMKRHFEDADTKVYSFKNWTLVSISVKNTFCYSLWHAQLKGIQNLFNLCLKSSPRSPLEDFDLENGYSAVIKDSKNKNAEDWPNLWACASKVACHQSNIIYCFKKHTVLVNISTSLVLSDGCLWCCFFVRPHTVWQPSDAIIKLARLLFLYLLQPSMVPLFTKLFKEVVFRRSAACSGPTKNLMQL